MKVVVAGANGTTGKMIVEKLVKNGHEVYAIVRKPEQVETMEQLQARPILADLTDDLSSSLQKKDAVIFAAGAGGGAKQEQTTAVDRDAAIHLMKAAMEKGVNRFVMLSSVGTEQPEKGPEGLQHYLQMKQEADAFLLDTDLDYTIVRPVALTNDNGTGLITVGKTVDYSATVTREDVASTIVECLESSNTSRKVFEMTNGDQSIKEAISTI